MNIFAPCRSACPLEVDITTYIAYVAQGKFQQALEIIRQENPLPSVCGCVCHHPCEDECRRNKIDEPIAIAAIKRAAANFGYTIPSPLPIKYSKKIAVVGGGPAGLGVAYHLLKLGYPVKIFERYKKLGGMLIQCIPRYRLPEEILDKDIEALLNLGLSAQTETEIDSTKLTTLADEYDAVVLAVGLPLSKTLHIDGAELPQVFLALDILRKLNLQDDVGIYGQVVVIGGGNVAIDVGRSLWRLPQVKEVVLVCLESETQMPAFAWEVDEARKEGIKIIPSFGPKRIVAKQNNKIAGIECMQVKSLFDNLGQFSPQFFTDKTIYIDCDFVVIAIGQQMDKNLFTTYPIEAIKENKFGNIYLCGDIDIGASSVVRALAEGKKLAYLLHSKFTNGPQIQQREKLQPLTDSEITLLARLKRQPMPTLPPAARKANFEQVEKGYSVWAAQVESLRCLRCTHSPLLNTDKCTHCLNCLRVCQNGAIEIQKNTPPNPQKCIGCGTCVATCPNNALYWEMPLYQLDIERVSGHINDSGEVEIACVNVEDTDGVRVACVSHISELDLLWLIERGAKKIEFKICRSDNCRTPKDTMQHFHGRIQNLKNLLCQANIEAFIDCTYS